MKIERYYSDFHKKGASMILRLDYLAAIDERVKNNPVVAKIIMVWALENDRSLLMLPDDNQRLNVE